MRKEIIIEKEDCKYKVAISLYGDNWYGSKLSYRFDWLKVLPKGKRKWESLTDKWRNSYSYRETPYTERDNYMKSKYLECLTAEDIVYIKAQLFDEICIKLSPSADNNYDFAAH